MSSSLFKVRFQVVLALAAICSVAASKSDQASTKVRTRLSTASRMTIRSEPPLITPGEAFREKPAVLGYQTDLLPKGSLAGNSHP